MAKIIIQVLSKMLNTKIACTDNKTTILHGGTLGNVKLITGECKTATGRIIPYKIVSKTQEKWERPGDPDSWHREYDLYKR